MRYKQITVIKTQKELDDLIRWEEGKYYLVLGGRMQVPDETQPWVNKIEGEAYIDTYMKKIPSTIKRLEIMGYKEEVIEETVKELFQTYLVPWKYH